MKTFPTISSITLLIIFALSTIGSSQDEPKRQPDEIDTLREQVQDLKGLLKLTIAKNEKLVEQLEQQKTQLVAQLKEATKRRDEQFKKVVELTDQLRAMEAIAQRAALRHEELGNQIDAFHAAFKKMGMEIPPIAAPKIETTVSAVSKRKSTLFEIAAGADEGLREGHQVIVIRKKEFLGAAIVRRVADNAAVCEFVDKPKLSVKIGDQVVTRPSLP